MVVKSPLAKIRKTSDFPSFDARPMTARSSYKEVSDPNDVNGRYSLVRKRQDRANGSKNLLPFCPDSKLPAFLEHDKRILIFNCYFEEEVFQSALETNRLHTCEISFYVEDGTLEIMEKRQENSGIPQGVFLRRGKVTRPKSCESDDDACFFYGVDDFKIGSVVEMCGRKFHIVSCNERTKRYVMEHYGWREGDVAPRSFPRDGFAVANKEKMKRETGVPGVNRNRKMHELKEVMESMLGKPTSMTDRGMFLEFGQDVLCFHVIWDDRQTLYGDIQYFKLVYYLADDTIELVPLEKKDDGRHPFPKLLKRSKLPRTGRDADDEVAEFYTWKDLAIGESIHVYGREMLVARTDSYTRKYYLSRGVTLATDMTLEPEEVKVVIENQIPPYNGFGSEEDSLRSCTGGINPPPLMKDLAKMRDKQGVVLRFHASLLSDKAEDSKRRFVIQYFMEDDTIGILEPPIQNSGVVGGKFLRRLEHKKSDGTRYSLKDMYVGNPVEFVSHKFVLLSADEYTYRLMENDERTFPFSNFSRLHVLLAEKVDDIKKYFIASYKGDGTINFDGFAACCKEVGMQINKQETITLWRKMDRKGKGKASFTRVIKLASDKPMSMWS